MERLKTFETRGKKVKREERLVGSERKVRVSKKRVKKYR